MPDRLVVLGSFVATLAACGKPSHDDHAPADGGITLTDGGLDPDAVAVVDADVVDAPVDAFEPDVTPPVLASIAPATGTAVWLHAPIRLTFDEPLSGASMAMTATASIGGAAVAATLTFEAPSTIAVTLPAAARGVGAVEIDINGSIADIAGNAYTAPIDLSFVAAPWSGTTTDRGTARSAPELAVSANGNVWAAWLVGNPGARRAVVSVIVGNTWLHAGGELGSGDVTSVSIALAQDGATLVAWADGGQAHVARWDNIAWTELAAPGAADHVALATPPGGAPMLALFSSTSAGVRRLDGGTTWQAIGVDVALPAPVATSPALVAMADARPAIGWVDTAAQLRVYRYDAAWAAIAPLAVTAGSRMSLAARGTAALAIAWDQLAGSHGVLAAQASGAATTWTRLGRALDIDITGDAVAPAIAYDAAGAPVVAWTELVETRQRGAIARWSGSGWSIVGGVTWLDDSAGAPLRTRIALHVNEPIVATAAAGTIRVARFNGPSVAAAGIAARASIAGCAFDAASPPAQLSLTGCFNLATPSRPVPHAGLIPFDVVSELWSDGAKKRRYIGLPDGAGMTLAGNGSWLAPAGTLIIKQFDLETSPGDPSTRRPIETRFLVNDAALGWQGFTYRWNVAGTNATLLTDGAFTVAWPMDDGSQHSHLYPSRAHCRSCHHASMGPMLGLRSEQLARWVDYDGIIADQLVTLAALGIAPVASAQPVVSAHDPGEPVDRRMRGYMAGNCAHCHNPQYLNIKDLRFSTALAQTRLCDSITPGSPSTSRVYQLVTTRPGMPALGTLAVDPLAEQLLGTWITNMASCP